jgi:hypothetical protein
VNTAGGGSANGLVGPGLTTTFTNVIQVQGTGAAWKVVNASGVSIEKLDHLTLSLLPTNATRSWKLAAVDASGAEVGNAITLPGPAGTYTNQDVGPGAGVASTYWTVCTVPLSDLGVSDKAYGFVLTDSSGVASNTWYISAVGFYGIN